MTTEALDFVQIEDKWIVYAKNSQFVLGAIEWRDDKKAYDYAPNANGKLMKITQQEQTRNELLTFCRQQTQERVEAGGNKA
jgi:hypothetical protein